MQSFHRLILPLCLALPAAAAAAPLDEARNVPDFEGVYVGSGIHARIEEGARSVVLRAEPELLRIVRTEVKNGKLDVQVDPEAKDRPRGEIHLTVRMPKASSLGASGGADVEAAVPTADNFGVAASGGSHLTLTRPLRGKKLDVAGAGGSIVVLAGTTGEMNLALAGGSELQGSTLTVGALTVNAAGGSTAAVRARTVNGALAGGCRVRVPAGARVSAATVGGSEVVQDL